MAIVIIIVGFVAFCAGIVVASLCCAAGRQDEEWRRRVLEEIQRRESLDN